MHMPDSPLLLGIDVGTTGAKAILITAAGAVLAEATSEYPMATRRPLWAEQNPHDWWSATVASVREVLHQAAAPAEAVAGVGLTGQMHGLVLLDEHGEVLRPCIMWNDQRTGPQCAAITGQVGEQRLLQLTGNPVLPGFTAPKIVWVRENEPEVYGRIKHVLLPKDYIRYRLTGEFFSDVSDASGTAMFDVGGRCWSEEMLAALDVPKSGCRRLPNRWWPARP
jgi:xylulokinase